MRRHAAPLLLGPGNIYSQRGTLSFDWRSRTPVGKTEFPIFRVGYGDHSSWDMVWLRIDYNGHGFDAFVTDVNLGRTRVSYTMPNFPEPDEWVHLSLAWDETTGIKFYVNGKLAGEKAATGMFDAALDQFGPHSRLIAPTGVESSYNYDRGGDIDEVRIYDRMISDDNEAALARHEAIGTLPELGVLSHLPATPPGKKSGGTATVGTAPAMSPPHFGQRRPPSARSKSTVSSTSSASGGRPPTASAKPPGPAFTTVPAS